MPITINVSQPPTFPTGDVPRGKGVATQIPFTIDTSAVTQLTVVTSGLTNVTNLEILGWRYTQPGGTTVVYVGGPLLNVPATIGLPITLFVRAISDPLSGQPPQPLSATFHLHGAAGVDTRDSENISVTGTIVSPDAHRAAFDLALDRSAYMDDTTIARTKAASLRLLQFMTEADWIGVMWFTNVLYRMTYLKPLTPANRAAAEYAINALSRKAGSISSVFRASSYVVTGLDGLSETCACGPTERAMLMITMGVETGPGFLPPPPSGTSRFALALAGTTTPLLDITPNIFSLGDTSNPNEMFKLDKYLLQSLAQMAGPSATSALTVILDPSGTLSGKEHVSIPFPVADTDSNIRIVILVDDPDLIQLSLQIGKEEISPRKFPGAALTRGNGLVEFSLDRSVLEDLARDQECYDERGKPRRPRGGDANVPLPAPSTTWHANLSLSSSALERGSRLKPVPYAVMVFADSDLVLRGSVHQDGEVVGSNAFLTAWLTEYGAAVSGERVRIFAEVRYPDGGHGTIELKQSVLGRFQAELRCTQPGTYCFRILARGTTFRGNAFHRELNYTAFASARARSDCRPCAPPPRHGMSSPDHAAAVDEVKYGVEAALQEPADQPEQQQERAPQYGANKPAQLGRALGTFLEAVRQAKEALR